MKMMEKITTHNILYVRPHCTLRTEKHPCVTRRKKEKKKKENIAAEAGGELTSEDYGGYST